MKLLYKDTIGFSCLILIVLMSGLFLNDTQLKINEIHENLDMLSDDEQEKLIQRHSLEFTFVIFGMIVFMMCVIVMIMTFSRNPMLSNIKNIKNATTKISKGDFNVRIPEIGNKDEIADLCTGINMMAEKLSELHQQSLKDEKMITIGNFSSRLAHDMRNPLSVIQMTLDNVRLLYGEDKTKQEHFKKIDRSITRMVHQIDDVLDFVKEKSIILSASKTSKIIYDSLDSIIIPTGIDIIIPENDLEITCDQKQMVAVLNNLILNSIQAITKNGTIKIRVEGDIDEITIQVEDSGPGIPVDKLETIFEPLFTTKQQGTGLGLASVKLIVESHGGIISAKNNPTIFTITLPKNMIK